MLLESIMYLKVLTFHRVNDFIAVDICHVDGHARNRNVKKLSNDLTKFSLGVVCTSWSYSLSPSSST